MKTAEYLKLIEKETRKVYDVAEAARAKNLDPATKVEIPLAKSLAEKVVGLISAVYPQMEKSGIVECILNLEKEHGKLDPMVAFKIAEDVAKQKFCKFSSLLEAIEAGIRVGFAYATLGVVSSPIEGFTKLELKKAKDGKDYFCAYFSGPIRSAGTTASCLALMLIDYLREMFGYATYDPTEEEIKRYVVENHDYHERVTNLQYMPTDEEISFLAERIPIQIDGEPTEKLEVSNYKNLPRIATNYVRGGMALIFSEGLAQKAAKGFRYLNRMKQKGLKSTGFDFLAEYIKLHEKRDKGKTDNSPTYINDLVAGRPVFGHPSRSGAFRFRYGRGRSNGFSATSVNPATMGITDEIIALGTQLKLERPTKGCIVTSCDSIDGPIVKLKNGSVRKIKTAEEAKKIYSETEEIIYLGDILFPFSDVANRNANLLKPGYVEEIWQLELREKISSMIGQNREKNPEAEKSINPYNVLFEEAVKFSREYGVSLHPSHIFYWTEISKEQFINLLFWLRNSKADKKIILPYTKIDREKFTLGKRALELLGLEHEVTIENVVIGYETSKALLANLSVDWNILDGEDSLKEVINPDKFDEDKPVLEIINRNSSFNIRDKAGEFVGARMGRPEKAKLRKLVGSPNVLFPVGAEGGRLRSFQAACDAGNVFGDFPVYFCDKCKTETIYPGCENCGEKTKELFYCYECRETKIAKCEQHERSAAHYSRQIDINHYFQDAVGKLGLTATDIPPLIKGVRGTSSSDHATEHLAKGILRARLDLQVNKDGTIRFDATELPLVSFKPKEAGVSVEKLREIGYLTDINGAELKSNEQILELKPHDILLPSPPEVPECRADNIFIRIANFVDELLVRFYGLEPFYKIRKREDLVGQLGVCMAPHNCAGVVCRIVGFSNALGLFASPYMHAAIRRDCLAGDNYVAVQENNIWKVEKIGNFIDGKKPENKIDIYGTLGKKVLGMHTWSNPGKGKIKEITKHQPTDMIKLYLEDGRMIKTTRNHKIFTKGKNMKKAEDVSLGDKLMITYKRDIEEIDIEELFLPEIFEERDDVMLSNIRGYLNKFERLSKHDNFYQRDSYPIKLVKKLLLENGKSLGDLPEDTKISIKKDNVKLPIRIKVDNELLEIIGLYIAGGYLRKKDSKKGFYQISIAGNAEIKNLAKKVFLSHFNLRASYENRDQVVFSSRIIYELFKDYFNAGSGAKTKRIPSVFLNLKKEKIASLLRGYFEGDGSASLSDIKICCDTVSEGLKHDLSFVLSRFGIYTKFYEYEKEPGNKVKQFYIKKNREISMFKITKITILSDFVKNFKQIGFLSQRKKDILEKICQKKPYGTRIDHDEIYAYPKVKKIEESEGEITYCFNVESEHNFFANDILVKNCDGDEAAVMLLGDVLLNFSREFLPSHRGGTQDAPLVLNARIDAGEVDEQILDFELVPEGNYPLELYRLAEQKKHSSEIKVYDVRRALKEGRDPFVNLGFTHNTGNINDGVVCSNYKMLATMQEKVRHQMELVEKIRAADTSETARLVIERHFLRDLRGNLRKFSMQEFRCVACNEIMRRPPLTGVCPKCQGKIIFTTHEGGIKKYLEPALELARRYNLSSYIQQSLELTKRHIDSVFGKEPEVQEALEKWF